ISVSTTSAASTLSPDLNVRSMTRPVFRLRTLTRLNAWPLPGFTISFSTIEYGSFSRMILRPDLNSFVEKLPIWHRGPGKKVGCPARGADHSRKLPDEPVSSSAARVPPYYLRRQDAVQGRFARMLDFRQRSGE